MSKTSKTTAIISTKITSAHVYKSTNKDQNQTLRTLRIPSMCKSSQKDKVRHEMTPSNIKVTNSVFKVIYKAYMDINQQSKRRHVVYTISTIYLCANQAKNTQLDTRRH